jgi:hypothetical protein
MSGMAKFQPSSIPEKFPPDVARPTFKDQDDKNVISASRFDCNRPLPGRGEGFLFTPQAQGPTNLIRRACPNERPRSLLPRELWLRRDCELPLAHGRTSGSSYTDEAAGSSSRHGCGDEFAAGNFERG